MRQSRSFIVADAVLTFVRDMRVASEVYFFSGVEEDDPLGFAGGIP